LGRWISRDPLAETGGISLYFFINNNPINLIDKNGLVAFSYDEAQFFSDIGTATQDLYYQVEYNFKQAMDSLVGYVKDKFDKWAEDSKHRYSFQVQDRNKFPIGLYGEINWGFNAKITGSSCKTVVNGGAFGGIKLEFPIGFSGLSMVGGGAVSGQLVSEYDWGLNTIDRDGIIKFSGYGGLRYGVGFIVLNTGAKAFVEAGGTISISYSLSEEEFDDFKIGVYFRAVLDVGIGFKVVRHEHKYTYGGDPGIF
jgi:hypothetical protein